MEPGLSQYLSACWAQAAVSWRRGAVIMTVLISAALIGGLYLGWHLSAYPTSYFLIGTGAIAAFDVLAIFPYQLWKADTAKIAELENRQRAKLKCSFDMNDPGCRRSNTVIQHRIVPSMSPVEMMCDWLRIRVDSDCSENITGCKGRLIHIKRDGAFILSGETPILPFAPAENDDAIDKTIYPGIPEFLDFMFVTHLSQVCMTPYGFVGSTSVDWRNLFSQTGVYEIRLAVLAAQGAPALINIDFDWTGEFINSKLSAVLQ